MKKILFILASLFFVFCVQAQDKIPFSSVQNTQYNLRYIDVTAFGVNFDTTQDQTARFQAALNYMSAQGGGSVLTPSGAFKIAGHLVIPINVRLMGTWVAPATHTQAYNSFWGSGYDLPIVNKVPSGGGSILLITGIGAATDSAAVEMTTNSKIEGFCMYWPNQVGASQSTPIVYPFGIHAKQANNVTVENIEILNAYQGVFFEKVHRGIIRNVVGQPLFIGIYCAGGGDVNRLENIHFGAWISYAYDTSNYQLGTYVNNNADAFRIGREDQIMLMDCFAYGYGISYHFISTPQYATQGLLDGAWCMMTGCGADASSINVKVEYGQPRSIIIQGGQYINVKGNPSIVVSSTFAGRLNFSNVYIYNNTGQYATIAGSGMVQFQNCIFTANDNTFNNGSSTSTGIAAIGTGQVSIEGCTYNAKQPQASFGSTLSRAAFIGNTVADTLNVVNSMSVGYLIDRNIDSRSPGANTSSTISVTKYTPIYVANFNGANGTSFGSYVADTGTASLKLGAASLDGNGNLVFGTSAYNRISVTGGTPTNRRITTTGFVLADTKNYVNTIRDNGSQYAQVALTRSGTSLNLQVGTSSGIAFTQNGAGAYSAGNNSLIVTLVGNAITMQVDNGTVYSYTLGSSFGTDTTDFDSPGGGTIGFVRVESITTQTISSTNTRYVYPGYNLFTDSSSTNRYVLTPDTTISATKLATQGYVQRYVASNPSGGTGTTKYTRGINGIINDTTTNVGVNNLRLDTAYMRGTLNYIAPTNQQTGGVPVRQTDGSVMEKVLGLADILPNGKTYDNSVGTVTIDGDFSKHVDDAQSSRYEQHGLTGFFTQGANSNNARLDSLGVQASVYASTLLGNVLKANSSGRVVLGKVAYDPGGTLSDADNTVSTSQGNTYWYNPGAATVRTITIPYPSNISGQQIILVNQKSIDWNISVASSGFVADGASATVTKIPPYTTFVLTASSGNTYQITGISKKSSRFLAPFSGTATLSYNSDNFYNGTGGDTWTLPTVSAYQKGSEYSITIKNRGTGSLTVSGTMFTTAAVSSITLAVGDAVTLLNDGTYFNAE